MITNQLLNDQYQIVKTLHRTNFSKTFQGIDTNTPTGRKCLIKQLNLDTSNPRLKQQLQERFKKEAQILENLGKHPQIPFLYAYFSENNQFYLVQEWIEGCNLEETVQQRGPLAEAEVKDILIKLLPVLEFIHNEHKIIHRDIKPNNIMLDASGLPILIDFGIVKEILSTASQSIPPTACVGTPGFMPPEQASRQPIFASDLYSLGLTAIYMLTKKLPNSFQRSRGKLSWRQYASGISQEFGNVLNKAIEENARKRYSAAGEMLNDLTNNNEVAPTELSSATSQFFSKNRWLKIIMIAIIEAVVGAVVIDLYNRYQIDINQPEPVETPTPQITARDKFNAAVQKAEAAINQAETAPNKAELEAAKNKLEAAILELENVPKGDGIDGKIKVKELEYKGIVNRIDEALQKQPCYEKAWNCQPYPVPLLGN